MATAAAPRLERLAAAWRIATGTREARWRSGTTLAAVVLLVSLLGAVLGPMLRDFRTYGFHDWDVQTAHRYLTVVAARHFEGPWWNPWFCGGFPEFAHPEGGVNFVSPYLPVYLLFDVRTALRVEVLGSALTGLAGAYALTACFTRSVALRALVAVLYVLNSRWALQAAVGHTWHLQYGFLPWVFWFFEKYLQTGEYRRVVHAGGVLALMAYVGGIYPLPHAALGLALYALALAALQGSFRPVAGLAIAGFSSLALALPKLAAIVDTMGKAPRLIESKETIDLGQLLVMMTSPDQGYGARPVRTPAYNWHEWGIYVGWTGVALLTLAVLFGRGRREHALKVCGVAFFFLGLGAFHEKAPWALLHELPMFSSQHVPSRFHYTMLLFLGVVFASVVARLIDRHLSGRPWIDALLLLAVGAYGADLAVQSNKSFRAAFWMEQPAEISPSPDFEHQAHSPVSYVKRDWAEPMLMAMYANTGVIECYGIDPGFKDMGAKASDRPGYRGRAWMLEGGGEARVVDWSPNRAVVRVSDAKVGSRVVYNMNYDPSWRANGEPALDHEHTLAARVHAPDAEIVFSYFPRTLRWSLPVSLLFGALVLAGPRVLGRWRRRRGPPSAPVQVRDDARAVHVEPEAKGP